jgi:thioredoxin 1
MKGNQVREINEAEFNSQVLGSKQPVLVSFVAGWSPACGRIEPVLEEVARAFNGTARVFKVDVDDNPDLGTEYGIQSVPTLIFFCDGVLCVKVVGTVSARGMLAKLEPFLQRPESNKPGPQE